MTCSKCGVFIAAGLACVLCAQSILGGAITSPDLAYATLSPSPVSDADHPHEPVNGSDVRYVGVTPLVQGTTDRPVGGAAMDLPPYLLRQRQHAAAMAPVAYRMGLIGRST